MQPGDVVADRFVIERTAGSGGMGVVYRASDRQSGRPVALKVLVGQRAQQSERFTREAFVLAELKHPGIVGYVDHGVASSGALYLVMEWLEGCDLAARLARGAMAVDESILVLRQAAEALVFAHARGIVHRDIKPSNLFLVDGRIDRVRLLDFGVARLVDAVGPSTQTGMVVGTPGYMAPEQARGDRSVDARADVFSLGCVLFECLTGRAAFIGAHVMALLAKILLEDAPRVRSLRAEIPHAVDALADRMLSKDPASRPGDAAELVAQLDRLGAVTATTSSGAAASTATTLTTREQRLLCVIAIGSPSRIESTALAPTVTPEQDALTGSLTFSEVERFGGRLQPIADGSMIAILRSRGSATDQAARAARCALTLRRIVPGLPMSLSTGRGIDGDRWPVGEAIDRAVRILRAAEDRLLASRTPADLGVSIDEVTAGLLEPRFDVAAAADGLVLRDEREIVEGVRTLLGRETPCVGREVELRTLEAVMAECASERLARGVLVIGASGMGKSRLRHEFLRRAAAPAAGDGDRAVQIWTGRGDAMSAGSPFALVAGALRVEAGVRDGEPLEARQAKLRARIARHVSEADVDQTTEFLGEIAGAPFPDADRVQLRAARQDPILMADRVRSAWLMLLRAECRATTLVLVLEDLHWGDLPTVRLVDDLLRELEDEPLMVLALARPEIDQRFSSIWAGRGITRVQLVELSRRAAERLVRHVLGADVIDATLARIVEQAAGNALYLEELIRAVAEGKGDCLPDTVLAMVQARLEALEPDARRILRAASIFGQSFWRRGVGALLGDGSIDIDAWLRALVARELVVERTAAKFPGEDELAFRHDVVREASYAMLVDKDRETGHRLAGAWLESAGERDAVVLAEHFERGAEPARAVGWYRRAAEQALEVNDLAAAIARAERGVTSCAAGEALAALRLVEAEAHGWRGDIAQAEAAARDAMRHAERGSVVWCRAAGQVGIAAGKLGNRDLLVEVGEALAEICAPDAPPTGAVAAAALASQWLVHLGNYELADRLFSRLETLARSLADPVVAVRVHQARAVKAKRDGDIGRAVELNEAATSLLEQLGNERSSCNARARLGYAYAEIGDDEQAERTLRDSIDRARRMGLSTVEAFALQNLGFVLARRGKLEEARHAELAALESFRQKGERRMAGACRFYLAMIAQATGALSDAEVEARRSVEELEGVPPVQCYALAVLARVLLAAGRSAEALEVALAASKLLDELGGTAEGEELVRLAIAEALDANGDPRAGRAIADASARVTARAARITDRRWRSAFLGNVPENVRILELAAARGLHASGDD